MPTVFSARENDAMIEGGMLKIVFKDPVALDAINLYPYNNQFGHNFDELNNLTVTTSVSKIILSCKKFTTKIAL